MAPFLLLACMHRAPVDSSHLDTGASSDADAAAHALLAANLDCGLTPSMALDADALVAVIGFTLSTPNWLLTDNNILAVTSNFTQGNPDQGCFTRGESDFSATCEDVDGWTITGSMVWEWGDWQSGVWTGSGACSYLVLDDPIGDWQFTADGRWQVDHAEDYSMHIDIDRRWTNSGSLGGAIGEFSLIAAGDYAMGGVYSGALTARGSDLPDGSACFAVAVTDDAGWSAVQGKRLWERKQFTNASGEACSTWYRDGVEVSTECG